MSKASITALLAALAALAGCSGSSVAVGGGPPPMARDRDSCTSSDDCTLVEACCGCSAAGRRVAIRADAVAEYDATRAERCGDSVCTQVISTHSSCNAEAVCSDGRCRVAAHMERE